MVSVSVHNCPRQRGTYYECGRRKHCMSIGGYLRRYVVGASILELGLSGWERPQSRNDLKEIDVSDGGRRLWDERIFRTEDDFGKIRCDGG